MDHHAQALHAARLQVAYGYVEISELAPGDIGADIGLFTPVRNGLIDVHGDTAYVWTAIHTGEIGLHIDLLQEPPPLEVQGWEDVVEVSIASPLGALHASCFNGPAEPDILLAHTGPGTYRLRIHAAGRDQAAESDEDSDWGVAEPVERYLLVIWPAPLSAEIAYRMTSSYGAELRNGAAG